MNTPSTPSVPPRRGQTAAAIVAVLLWLLSFGLGLQAIYVSTQIYYLVSAALGQSTDSAATANLGLVFVLALGFLVFIIASTEYHLKRVGKPESWRLFGWTLAVELSIIALYYIL